MDFAGIFEGAMRPWFRAASVDQAKVLFRAMLGAFAMLLGQDDLGFFVVDGRDIGHKSLITEFPKTTSKGRWPLTKQVACGFTGLSVRRGRGRNAHGAANSELLFIIPPAIVKGWSELMERTGAMSECFIEKLTLPVPAEMPQCTAEMTGAIWSGILKRAPNTASVCQMNDARAMRSCGKLARGHLRDFWWDRYPCLHGKYIPKPHAIDFLVGLSPMGGASALACASASSAAYWLGRCFNSAHVPFVQ